jgi:hypothetical protein
MAEFLSGTFAVILEKAYVFDARVALEVENALGNEAQEVADLIVAGIPQIAIVTRVLHDYFVCTDRVHAVINAVAAAARIALNAI